MNLPGNKPVSDSDEPCPFNSLIVQIQKSNLKCDHRISVPLPFLQLLPFFLRCGQDHGQVRSVHLKEDAVLGPGFVSEGRGVDQLVVLIVGESLLHHDVQHGSGVGDGHLGLLLIVRFNHKVLREGVGEDTPDPVSVQLQGPPEKQK